MHTVRRRRTHRQYYPEQRMSVYFRLHEARAVDGSLVEMLPTCYTWRRHNAIIIVWPPTYDQPWWRIKCCVGFGPNTNLIRHAPHTLQMDEVMYRACTMMRILLPKVERFDTWRAEKISKFVDDIMSQCEPRRLVAVGE